MTASSRERLRPTLRQWLSSEPFALALSSGFFGFFAHAGMLTVLEDEGLLPERLSGSSAGALVAGAWAAGIDAPALSAELLGLQRSDFWDPAPGLGLLRGTKFQERLGALLPAKTFAECRVPLAVSVFDVLARRTVVLDRGPLAPAIQASCTLPILFHPRWLAGRPVLDGGIADRSGLLGLPASTRVLHHHLSSRSPWRGVGSGLRPPVRARLCALVVDGLPRVDPFRLYRGRTAFEQARRATRAALDRSVDGNVVRVRAAGP